jgi:hypothetical protein
MSEVSAFDPNQFLEATTTEVNERRNPLPTENPATPDGLYTAVIGEIKTDSGVIGKGEKLGQPWVSMLIPLKIEVPAEVQQAFKLDSTFTLTDRAFLDLTPQGQEDNGPGKSRQKKAYRDATGLNVVGEPFAWRMLSGRVVKVKVVHEMYNGVPQERVSAILPS